jgi:hypothetical protein
MELWGAFLRHKGRNGRIIWCGRDGGPGMKRAWGKARAVIALGLVITMVNSAIAQAAEIIAPSNTYIVTVDGDFNDVVRGQLRDAGISIDDEFEYAFDGFVVELADYQLPFVESLQYVKAIEEDGIVTLAATQTPTPSWGLDRIDCDQPVILHHRINTRAQELVAQFMLVIPEYFCTKI